MEKTSYYQVLDVKTDADARAIKKAYAQLVRKFPPETHPEQFKRVREAYEVLSNPNSRREYDESVAGQSLGAETSAHLQRAIEALSASEWQKAQEHLSHVVYQHPELHFARDLLALAFLNGGKAAAALEQLDLLIAEQPENPAYHLHRGHTLAALARHDEATRAFARVLQLDPGEVRAYMAGIDCCVAVGNFDKAIALLDKAVLLDGKIDIQDLDYLVKKVHVYVLKNDLVAAEKQVDEILKILPDDVEQRKYVAQRLALMAADLFANKKTAEANALLGRARRLDPGRRGLAMQFPPSVRLPIATLPEPSKRWLREQNQARSLDKIASGSQGASGNKALIVFALLYSACSFNSAVSSTIYQSSNVVISLHLVISALLIAVVYRRVLLGRSYGRSALIHPVHLLIVDCEEVTAWPLLNLGDVAITHRHHNGQYVASDVRMTFGGQTCDVTIADRVTSEQWANRLLERRRQLLLALAGGTLEQVRGFDIIPPQKLTDGAVVRGRAEVRQRRIIFYASFALGGIVLGMITMPLRKRAHETALWKQAEASQRVDDFRAYLKVFPRGRFHVDAETRLGERYDSVRMRFESRVADSAGASTMVAILRALAKSDSATVLVKYRSELDPSFTTKGGPSFIPLEPAFTEERNQAREYEITQALRAGLAMAIPEDLMTIVDRSAPLNGLPPVELEIFYRILPSGEVYSMSSSRSAMPSATGKSLWGVQFEWNINATFRDADEHPVGFLVTSKPSTKISYTKQDGAREDIEPYQAMASTAFDDLSRRIAPILGVTTTAK